MDMASLPPNLYIGSNLRATRILIDRPMTTHAQKGQSPTKSNVGGSTLSVDTSSTPPARIIGLEYTNLKTRTGKCHLSYDRIALFDLVGLNVH